MKSFKFKTFHGIRALIAHATFRSLPHYFRSLPILLSMASSSASPPSFIPPNIGQLMTFFISKALLIMAYGTPKAL
jgi:hypothetical protein